MVRDTIEKTRGSAGPSGLDADGWSRILMSGNFGSSEDLRKAISDMTKPLCQDNTVKHIEAFWAWDKHSGVRSIGKDDILRRAIGKIVLNLLKKYALKATGSLPLCAEQDEGSEAVIHALY